MEKIRLKQKRLNHFLDLINADLEKLTDVEKYTLASRFLFSSPLSIFGKKQTGEEHWKAVLSMLPRVQELFKNLLRQFMDLQEGQMLPLPPVRRNLEIKDGHFNILRETILSDGPSFRQIIVSGIKEFEWERHQPEIEDPLEEMFLSDIGELSELLNGIPQTAFRKCENPKCGKLFLQISKKPKKYCSQSCAFKFLSKQRRERLKDDQSYKDKRSDEAHRSYKREIEKTLGPLVKVARRKRKKQKKTGT